MRFMIIVKSCPEFEAETTPQTPDEALMAAMADFHEQLARAGVLLDASGLQPSRKGWRIHYDGQKRTVVDGPFAESKELIAGYTTIQVRSREEAMEWSRRFPNPAGEGLPAVIEVRQLYELDDFTPNEQVQRFRDINTPGRTQPASA
ncbi:MAG: YciI family protein [Ramlibacter sp.]|nr:YciI family protein [Ramlibacter sp.]